MCGSGYNIFRFKYVEITNNWEHAQILILKNENGDEPWGSGGWETKVPKTREPKKEGKIRYKLFCHEKNKVRASFDKHNIYIG